MKTIHMIGNAHLDLVWLWRWQEGFGENKATFLSMLERLEENDDVVFTSSSAQLYQWVEENAPELFEAIRKRVREGKWVLCGGMWIQPDCNIPCGESFARQALLAQSYFQDRFGVTAKVGYNVDSFGHNGMMPQMLRLSGMDSYAFMRPGPHEKSLPGRNFIWESDDGSRVLAYRIPFSYNSFGSLEEHIEACLKESDPDVDALMCFYGVGNHGGGPTKENIAAIRHYKEMHPKDEVIFGDPNRYFQSIHQIKDTLPVYHGDLQHHASGCYSAHSQIKTMNRRAENALLCAEKFCSLSTMLNVGSYPVNFASAWERVLFNQFHDILAGTCIREACDDAIMELGEAISVAARNENSALQAISFAVEIEKDESAQPLVVFNPQAFDTEDIVEIESSRFYRKGALHVLDSDGSDVPCQEIDPHARVNSRRRITFSAKVPALGYAVYYVRAGMEEQPKIDSTALILENDCIKVSFNPNSGGMASLYDKLAGTEYLSAEAGIPVSIGDDSDAWSHATLRYDREAESFTLRSIRRVETGTVRNSVRVTSQYGNSTITQTFSLYDNRPDIQVHVCVNWQEHQKCLKLRFPLNLHDYKATYETPYGYACKPTNGDEEPMLTWMDVSGMQSPWDSKRICGVGILNNAKYSASIEKNVMSLTVLRSPVYAHHEPYILSGDIEYDYIDQGVQEFDYVIVPHAGTWETGGVVRKAAMLNQPFVVVPETYHKGRLPSRGGFLSVDRDNVQVTCLKKAEKGESWIIRLYEFSGIKTEVRVEIPLCAKTIQAELGPYEIATFAFDAQPDSPVHRVNFLELEEARSGAGLTQEDGL